jgi:hypothetical protein
MVNNGVIWISVRSFVIPTLFNIYDSSPNSHEDYRRCPNRWRHLDYRLRQLVR